MKQCSFPILSAEEAAAMIQNGQTIGFSAFTSVRQGGACRPRRAREGRARRRPPFQGRRPRPGRTSERSTDCPLVVGKVKGVQGRYRRKTALQERREMATMFYHIRNRDGRFWLRCATGPQSGPRLAPINRRRDAVRKLGRLS
jgi:hypothetical protein